MAAERIGIFQKDLPAKLAAIRSAVDGGDPKALRSAAHALKETSAAIALRSRRADR